MNLLSRIPKREPTQATHREAIEFFERLVYDLKKQNLGYGIDAISMERLDEAEKHLREVEECQRPLFLR